MENQYLYHLHKYYKKFKIYFILVSCISTFLCEIFANITLGIGLSTFIAYNLSENYLMDIDEIQLIKIYIFLKLIL
jgi:hypothetical protein